MQEKDGAAAAATGDARRTANSAMGYDWDRSRLLSSSSSSSAVERMNPRRVCSELLVCARFCLQGGSAGQEPAEVSGRRVADVAAWELGRHPIQHKRSHSFMWARAVHVAGLKRPAWQEAHPVHPLEAPGYS